MKIDKQIVKLEYICHLITDGKHGDCNNQEKSGYYFLSAKDVNNGKLNYTNARQITKEDFLQTHKRTQLEPLDILLSNSGTIGRMAIAKKNELTYKTTFQKSVAILKPNQDRVNFQWLYYYLLCKIEQLVNMAGGTAQKNLLLRDLREFKIDLSSLPTQQKIAGILSAYDDLIENNIRRIEILEEMARMLYREWFVKFRFPGHEAVQFVKSELGLIPEGWEVVNIGKIAKVKGGKRLPKGKVVLDNKTNHPYIRVKDMNDSGLEISDIKFIDDETYQSIKRYTISSEDIYISIAGTIGRVGCIPKALSGANLTENAAKICEINFIYQKLLLNFLHSELGQSQIKSGSTELILQKTKNKLQE